MTSNTHPLAPADVAPAAATATLPDDVSPGRGECGGGDPPSSPDPAPTRILHVINGEHYSGAERVQDLLARQLPHFGYEVGFACVKPGRFPLARESTAAALLETPMRGRFDLRVVGQLVDLIDRQRYALVHAHTPRSALVGSAAARRAGVPFVYHVHSPAGHDSLRRLADWFNARVERWSLRDVARIVAVSPSLQRYMAEQGFAADRVVCVPNGVPCAEMRGERLPPAGSWTLGTVALFRPRKGIDVLLEALAMLRSCGIEVKLRAIGGFESLAYETAILGQAERLGVADMVEWIGFTRNVDAEWTRIDLFVLPSLFGEGLPMVVLEAMAAGVPIIASRVEGIPEAVEHRASGLLVDPGSVSQLAAAIRLFVEGDVDHAAYSQRGRQRHAERFSDVAMARALADTYRDVLAPRGVLPAG